MVLALIQASLPFARIKRNKPADPKRRFYSLTESREAFIAVCPTEAAYREKYDAKVKLESSIPPFMTVIGTLNNFQYVMLDFDNITYKLHSLAKAVDVCFKTYHVFNIQYPEKCEPVWDFLNREFYHLTNCDTKTKPPTYMLLNEIKGN